jgi:hypothetical protein
VSTRLADRYGLRCGLRASMGHPRGCVA